MLLRAPVRWPFLEKRTLVPLRAAPSKAALVSGVILVLAAILLRRGQFGNPIAGLDEQLYLLVGDRLWHGELPYVAIWDRKPFGLFLLFGAIRALPGDPFFVAQLVATGMAALTAWIVAALARRWTGWAPAAMAGWFFLAGQIELWGDTIQSPVFYSLAVAIVALLSWNASRAPLARAAGWAMMGAMLLAGVAVQIKTNAVFEGAFFALWYLAQRWRAARAKLDVVRWAVGLAAVGALPTIGVLAFFFGIGEFPAWWQANVLSVLAKGRPQDAEAHRMLTETVMLLTPAILLALLGLWARTRRFTSIDADTLFVLGWVLASTIDFVAIGGYFPHYALPLLLPCAVLTAPAFALRRIGAGVWALSMLWPMVHTQYFMPRIGAQERRIAASVQAAMPSDVSTRCLFIFEGPVAYYQLTHACRVTRYAFSAHISSRREAPTLGEPAQVALDAAMRRHPGTVLTIAGSGLVDSNIAVKRRLLGLLRRDYHPIARLGNRAFTPDQRLVIWRRNDLSG